MGSELKMLYKETGYIFAPCFLGGGFRNWGGNRAVKGSREAPWRVDAERASCWLRTERELVLSVAGCRTCSFEQPKASTGRMLPPAGVRRTGELLNSWECLVLKGGKSAFTKTSTTLYFVKGFNDYCVCNSREGGNVSWV